MPDACRETCSGTKYHTSPVRALPRIAFTVPETSDSTIVLDEEEAAKAPQLPEWAAEPQAAVLGRDASSRAYPESGVKTGFHPASHHGGTERNVKEFNLINKYHVGMLPYFLDKLKSKMGGLCSKKAECAPACETGCGSAAAGERGAAADAAGPGLPDSDQRRLRALLRRRPRALDDDAHG